MTTNSLGVMTPLDDHDQLAVSIARQWSDMYSACSEARMEWNETERYVYSTDARDTENVQNNHDNTVIIPKLCQIADNLEANYLPALFPHEDWLSFVGRDKLALDRNVRRRMEAYLKDKHRLNNFYEENRKSLRDWIHTGNAFMGVDYIRRTAVNPLSGEPEEIYNGPVMYRINPRDIVFWPTATSFEASPKIIRSVYNMGDLERQAEESFDGEVFRAVKEKMEEARYWVARHAGPEDLDKYEQLSFDGFGNVSQYFNSGRVEVLTFYGDIFSEDTGKFLKNQKIVVVDRLWVVHMENIDSWDGRPYLYHVPWRVRPNNLFGQSPLANLVGMQYRINHLENGKSDAMDDILDPDYVITGDVELTYDGGSKIYLIPDGNGDVRPLAPDTNILNADLQINEYERKMEEMAGAPRTAMGIRTPGEKTAFEVSTLAEAANRVFQAKAEFYEKELLEKAVNAEIELARRNLADTDSIAVMDEETGVTDFVQITAKDLKSTGRFVPIGARHFARKNQLTQNLVNALNVALQDPGIAQHLPGQRIAEVLFTDLLDLGEREVYQPFGRIAEQAQAARLSQAAQKAVMEDTEVANATAEE